MSRRRHGLGLVEALLAFALLFGGLVALWAMLSGARSQVGAARAQMMLRVRAFEALEAGRRQVRAGALGPGELCELDFPEGRAAVSLERPEEHPGVWVLSVWAEADGLVYQLRAAVAGPVSGGGS